MADPAKQARADRLRQARKLKYPTATAAAEALGLPEQTYLGWEGGKNGFSHRAPWLAERMGVNLDWLMTGRGPMRKGDRAPVQARFEGLPLERQQELLDLLDFWESRTR